MTTVEEGGGGGGEETTSGVPESPRNRVKFLCSHGGKILPRPADGHLKYVGGETRVVSIARDISFSELMKKLSNFMDGDMVLKYQLIPEDLDALVSVKSDEDLRHMLDEYDRYENTATLKLRAFIFPANPIVAENHPYSMDALQQRYVDAINGLIRANRTCQSISSADTSPKSPESYAIDTSNYETMMLNGYQNSLTRMHRVHSSPSVSSLNGSQQNNHHSQNIHHNHQHHHNQHPRQHQHQPQPQPQYQHHHGYQPVRTPVESHKGGMPDRLISVRSVGRADSWRYQAGHNQNHYYPPARHNRGGGYCCSKCMYNDEHCAYMDRRIERECYSASPPPT